MSGYSPSKSVQVSIGGRPMFVNKDLFAQKSRRVHRLFKENPDADLNYLLCDLPTTPEIFRLIAFFCYGYQVSFTPENIIVILCLAFALDMENSHSPNNLYDQALSFIKDKIITGWNESVRSLKAMENQVSFQQAENLGLLDACKSSIVNKALSNPLLLVEPIKNPILDENDDSEDADDEEEEEKKEQLCLTTLHLQFYEPIILEMVQCKLGPHYTASNLYQYAKRWVFVEPNETGEDTTSEGVCSNTRKAVIEAIERLFPDDQSILSCASLSKMLQSAMILEASIICRDGFEVRIGRHLELATVSDLLIATQDYSKEEKYDTECVRRILKYFRKSVTLKDQSGLVNVAELVDDFLGEVANDIDLKKDSFISIAEMSIAVSEGVERSSDGIYRAIDIYLKKHRYLKDSEREEICAVLDCNKMSVEACEHAAQNERLPVRVTVQVLFSGQLRLRESSKSAEDNEFNDEEVKIQLEKMRFRVTELEKECFMLKKKIEKGCCSCRKMKSEKENTNVIVGNEDETSVHVELQQLQLSNYEEGSSKVEAMRILSFANSVADTDSPPIFGI